MTYNSYYGNFRNRSFEQIWDSEAQFRQDYYDSGLRVEGNQISNDGISILYYLLYGAYGGSTIASSNENQFKYQVFSLMFEYGPAWEKNLKIQSRIRELSEDDLKSGGKQIFNKALNPGTEPTTEELDYISEQTTSKATRGILEAYERLSVLLSKDVTKEFIDKFKKLFIQIALPERPLWYINNIEEDEQ